MAEINKHEEEVKSADPNDPQAPLDKKQAEMIVREVLQNMFVMGAVSNETTDIQNILSELETDSITPEAAVAKAREVENNRQDNYH